MARRYFKTKRELNVFMRKHRLDRQSASWWETNNGTYGIDYFVFRLRKVV